MARSTLRDIVARSPDLVFRLPNHSFQFFDQTRFEARAEAIAEHGVTMYVAGLPEMLRQIPAGVQVMLFRNEGNCDFDDRCWMFSGETAKHAC